MADDPSNPAGIDPNAPSGSPPPDTSAPNIAMQGQPYPQAPTLRPEMPGIAGLISQLIRPTPQQGLTPGQGGLQNVPRPSRAGAFEQFLGTFVNSLAQGMAASGHGPGANIRGAGAALMAPQQQQIARFQLQQQQAQGQSQQQLTQAEVAKTQMETQLAPKQLQMQEELKQLQLQYENDWKQAMMGQSQQKIDLTKLKDQWQKDQGQQKIDLENKLGTGKLNVAQELASYKAMDTASQVSYRATVAQSLTDRVGIAASALQSMDKLRTAQSVGDYQKAYNDVGIMAGLARSIGIAPGVDQILNSMPNPVNLPRSGAPSPTPAAPTSKNRPKGGGADKVSSLVNKYAGR